jgi:hypothetical protein
MRHLHCIPVPGVMTPGEAWAEICIMGHLVYSGDDVREWATIECDGEECASVQHA